MFATMVVLVVFGGVLVEIVDDLWRFHPLAVFALAFALYMLLRTIIWLVQRWLWQRR